MSWEGHHGRVRLKETRAGASAKAVVIWSGASFGDTQDQTSKG